MTQGPRFATPYAGHEARLGRHSHWMANSPLPGGGSVYFERAPV